MKLLTQTLTAVALSISLAPLAMAKTTAITHAKVHTLSAAGTLEDATVVVTDGRISAVGRDVSIPEDAEIIDGRNKVITPGLIGAFTHLGLTEIELSGGIDDATVKARGFSPTGAALSVHYSLNSDSALIPVNRLEGITSAASSFSSSDTLFQGQGSIFALDDNGLVKPHAFMAVNLTGNSADNKGGSRSLLWGQLYLALEEAVNAPTQLAPTAEWHGSIGRNDIAPLKAVLAGDMPLVIKVHRKADILQVIALKKRFSGIKPILAGAAEAWRVADALAEAQIGVILDPESNLPYSFEQLGASLANAGRLHHAGVRVAIGMETHNIRLARQHAANAVANGLPWEAGLRAISATVAQLYGLADMGQIAKGKRADLVIWSGDPLEVMEHAEKVMIHGHWMNMESRQSKLRDRYLKREADLPAAHTRP